MCYIGVAPNSLTVTEDAFELAFFDYEIKNADPRTATDQSELLCRAFICPVGTWGGIGYNQAYTQVRGIWDEATCIFGLKRSSPCTSQ